VVQRLPQSSIALTSKEMRLLETIPLLRAWRLGRPDGRLALMLVMLLGVAAWIVAMPFSEAVTRITMERMHLASPQFSTWAVQQISPAMYNFENRGFLSPDSLRLPNDAIFKNNDRGYFNHFPIRQLTWISRDQFGPGGIILYARSRYRGAEFQSKYRLEFRVEGGWNVRRLETFYRHE
jgi:hypothetical protein